MNGNVAINNSERSEVKFRFMLEVRPHPPINRLRAAIFNHSQGYKGSHNLWLFKAIASAVKHFGTGFESMCYLASTVEGVRVPGYRALKREKNFAASRKSIQEVDRVASHPLL